MTQIYSANVSLKLYTGENYVHMKKKILQLKTISVTPFCKFIFKNLFFPSIIRDPILVTPYRDVLCQILASNAK